MCIVGQSIVRKIPLRFQVVGRAGRLGGLDVFSLLRRWAFGGSVPGSSPTMLGLHSPWR